jgi:hypothetical protein
MATLNEVHEKLRAVAKAIALPEPPPAPARVEVIAVPQRQPWIFRIRRDDQGRIESVLAEPVIA